MADIIKTSVALPGHLHDRVTRVKDRTGYKMPAMLELGVTAIERELAAAVKRTGKPCPHFRRYPNGWCRHCYAAPGASAD